MNVVFLGEDFDPSLLPEHPKKGSRESLLSDYFRLSDAALRRSQDVEKGRFIAETSLIVHRALDAGYVPRSFLVSHKNMGDLEQVSARYPQAPIFVGSQEQLESLAGFHLHRGALASMNRQLLPSVAQVLPEPLAREAAPDGTEVGGVSRSRIAVFENLTDHTNLGAAFRSAAALGVDAVLVSAECADPLYRRAIRVSMGTVFQVPWTRIPSWAEGMALLKDAGYVVAGMTLGEGAVTLDELVLEDHQRLALVFGTEGHGLTAQADKTLDRRVRIPMMNGVDSLNVAASSALTFYAVR